MFRKNAVRVISILVTAFAFISCEIGLGSQVDTGAPTVSISYPPAGSVAMDYFIVAGTCSDDLAVSSVTVTLSGAKTYGPYDATLDSRGRSWSIVLNKKNEDGTYPILDGVDYTVTVTAKDKTGNVTTDKELLAIDNTAPVLLLTEPSSYGTVLDPESYGRTVNFVGEFAEDTNNAIANMEVNVYNKATCAKITTLSFANVDHMSSKNAYPIAKWFKTAPNAEDSLALYNNYMAMYGASTSYGTAVPVFFTLKLTDGAKKYQNTSDNGVTCGNTTYQYYLDTSDYENTFTVDGAPYPMNTNDIKNFLNGTDTTYASKKTEIKTALTNALSASSSSPDPLPSENASAASSMNINPKNNPTFTVSNCEIQKVDGHDNYGYFYYTKNSPLNITISSGLDNIKINFQDAANPVSVYVVKCSYDSTTDTLTQSSLSTDKKLIVAIPTTTANATSKTVSGILSDCSSNEHYEFVVEGNDINGNKIEADSSGPYAFLVQSNSSKPDISFDDISVRNTNPTEGTIISGFTLAGTDSDGTTLSDDYKFKFTGLAVSYTETLALTNPITATVKIYSRDSDTTTLITGYDPTVTINPGQGTGSDKNQYNWTATVTGATPASGNYKYIFTFTATDTDGPSGRGNSSSITRTVFVDSKPPVLSITNGDLVESGSYKANPFITEKSSYYKQNGSVDEYSYRGKWSDVIGSGTKSLEYRTTTTGAWTSVSDVSSITTEAGWTADIEVAQGTGKMIQFRATDEAGYVTTLPAVTNMTFDFAVPVITEAAAVPSTVNASGNISITGTVTDSYKMPATSVSGNTGYGVTIVAKNGSTELTSAQYANYLTFTHTNDSTIGYALTIPAAGNSGTWTVAINAVDSVGRSAAEKSYTVIVDAIKPNIAYTGSTDATFAVKTVPQAFGGTMSDNVGVTAVYYYIKSSESEPTYSTTDTNWKSASMETASTWSVTANLNSDTYTVDTPYYIYFAAKDGAGNATVASTHATIQLDNAKPVLSALTPSATQSKTDVTVSGTVTERNLASLTVTYSLNGVDQAANFKSFTATEIAALSSTTAKSYSFAVPVDAATHAKDGTYIFTVTAVDKAGQTASVTSTSVLIDTKAPVLVSTNIPETKTIYEDNSNLNTTSKLFTLTGRITDTAGVGATTLIYDWNGGSATSVVLSSIIDGTYTVSISAYEGLNKTLNIKVVDGLGNTSGTTSISGITIDYAVPVLNMTAIPSDSMSVGSKMQVVGTVTETGGMPTATPYGMTITLKKGATDKTSALTNSITSGSFSSYYTIASGDDGSWTMTVKATDAAGRSSAEKTYSISVDATPPTFTITKVQGSAYVKSSNYRVFNQSTTYQVSGTVIDNESSSGAADASMIQNVYYKAIKTGTVPAGTTYYTDISDAVTKGWSTATVIHSVAGTSTKDEAAWTAYVDATSFTENANYTLYFAASDKAGNISLISANPSCEIFLLPDNTAPALSVSLNGTVTDTAAATTSYSNDDIAITGTISENNIDSFSVVSSKSGVVQSTYTTYSGTKPSYTFTVPTISLSGDWTFTITAKDKAGVVSTWTGGANLDKDAPVLSPSNISDGDSIYDTSAGYSSGSYSVTGTWSDAGIDNGKGASASKLYYSTAATTPAVGGTWTQVVNGTNGTLSGSAFTVDVPVTEDVTRISFKTEDSLGNATVYTYAVTVDLSAPTIVLTSTTPAVTNNQTATPGNFVYTFTTADQKKLAAETPAVTAKYKTSASSTETITPTLNTHYTVSSTSGDKSRTTTVTVKTGTYHDGVWTITVNAKDAAGRSAESLVVSTTIDSAAPVVSGVAVSGITINGGKYYIKKANGATITGSVSDAVSGVDAVYVAVSSTGTMPTFNASDTTNWHSATIATDSTWSCALESANMTANKDNTVYVVAVDKLANNTSAGATTVVLYPDGKAPVMSFDDPGSYSVSGSDVTGYTYNVTYYRSDAVAITGKLTDTSYYAAGWTCADTSSNGGTNTKPAEADAATGASWSITPVATSTGNFVYTITVVDKAKYTSTATVTIVVDKDAPTLTISNATVSSASKLVSGQTITENNAYYSSTLVSGVTTHYYTVSGSWQDNDGGTGTAHLYYTTNASATTATAVTGVASTGWVDMNATTSSTGSTKWSNDISIAEGTGNSLAFYAVDNAGHKTAITRFSNLAYDFSAPVASFTSYSGTSYASTGSTQTITVKGKVSDTYNISTAVGTATLNGSAVSSGSTGLVISTGSMQGTVGTDTYKEVTFTITVDTIGTEDGIWVFTLGGTDVSGRAAASVTSSSIQVDTLSPKFTVVTADNVSVGSTAISRYFGKTESKYVYTMGGIISNETDVKTNASGVANLYYIVLPSAATPASASGKYTISPVSYNSKTYAWNTVNGTNFTTKSDKTVAWSTTVDLTSAISAGTYSTDTLYNVYVAAQDSIGNISVIADNIGGTGLLRIAADSAAPEASVTSPSAKGTYYGSTGLVVYGTLTEANLDNMTITATCNGTTQYNITAASKSSAATSGTLTITPATFTTYSASIGAPSVVSGAAYSSTGTNYWVFTFPASYTDTANGNATVSNEGLWAFTIKTTDLAGQTDVNTVSTTIDTTAPDLNLSNVSNGSLLLNSDTSYDSATQKYTVKFTWSDSASGLSKLYYSTYAGASSSTAIGTNSATAWVDTGCAITATSFAFPVTESTTTIAFMAVDAIGNRKVVNDTVIVDLSTPTIGTFAESGATLTDATYVTYNASAQSLVETATVTDARSMGVAGSFASLITPSITLNGTIVALSGSGYSTTTSTNDTYTLANATYGITVKEVLASKTVTVTYTTSILSTSHAQDGVWVFTLNAADAAGRSGTAQTTSVTVDTIKPAISTLSVGGSTFVGTGAVVQGDTWFKSTSLAVTGTYTEYKVNGSNYIGTGIETIYYWIGSVPTTSGGKVVLTGATGSFSPGTTATTSGVAYTKYNAAVDFSASGTHEMYLVAVDNAGNQSADYATQYTVQIDLVNPTVSVNTNGISFNGVTQSPSSSVLTNGKYNMVVSGTGVETTSGVKSITVVSQNNGGTAVTTTSESTPNLIAISGSTAITTATVSGSTGAGWTWTAAVPPAYYKSGSVQIVITDNADNSSTINAFTLALDNNSPVIALTSHNTTLSAASGIVSGAASTMTDAGNTGSTAETSVNGTVTLKGSATDTGALATVSLYYSLTDSSASATASTQQGSSLLGTAASNWEFSVPFSTQTSLLGITGTDTTTAAKDIYIKVAAVDTAANASWYVYKFNVDRNADRPVITLISIDTPLSGKTPTLQSSILRGSISDDDGVSEAKVYVGSTPASDTTDASWNTLTISNGVFTFNSLGSDGTKDLYFYVKDKANGTYFTKYSTTLGQNEFNRLYFKFGDSDTLISGSTHATLLTKYDEEDILDSTSDYGIEANAAIEFKKDTQNPTLGTAYIKRGQYLSADGKSIVTQSGGSTSVDTETITSSIMLGGTKYRYFILSVSSSDDNGIASVVADVTTVAESGIVLTTTAENGVGTWTSAVTDISGYASGVKTITFVSTDKCNLEGSSTYSITLDNSAPTGSLSSPLSTEEVTGSSIAVKGTMSDADSTAGIAGSGITNIEYLVPVSLVSTKKTFTAAEVATMEGWSGTRANASATVSWEFDFDGISNNSILSHVYNGTSDVTNYYVTDTNGLYIVPIVFRITDSLGNYGYITTYTMKFNRFGDRPVTSIVYPDPKYNSSAAAATLGGNIRVSGSATDNVAVGSVYMQIDWDGNGSFNSADYTKMYSALTSASEHVYSTANFYAIDTATYSGATAATCTTYDADNDFWGYKISGTASWYQTINTSGELEANSTYYIDSDGDGSYYKADGTTPEEFKRLVAVRFASIDTSGTLGSWSSTVYIVTDSTAPRIGSTVVPYIAQYGEDNTGSTVTASRTWTTGMFLKGSWYLWTSVEDESGIDSYTVKVNGTEVTPTAEAFTGSSTNGYKLKILIPSATRGTKTIVVTTTDKSEPKQTQSATYTVYVDNPAPTIGTLYQNGDNSLEEATVPAVVNSDYLYTLKSEVTDNDSGFERMAFFFYRTDTSSKTARIYAPMGYITSSDTTRPDTVAASAIRADLTDSSTLLSAVPAFNSNTTYTSGTITSDAVTTTANLYGMAYTDATRTEETSFTNAGIKTNMHIRKDGLAKIGGVYHKITAVDRTTGTITFDSAVDQSYHQAFFPYAQVADHTATETYNKVNGIITFTNSSDDGDGMVETVTNIGTKWTWTSSIYSDLIPDGPITIVCVAFDAAGNISTKTISTTVENNPLRLAQVYLGTDLNGNGKFANDEFSTYDIQHVEGTVKQDYALETLDYSTYDTTAKTVSATTRARFIAKDKLAVAMQFTGGNYDYTDSKPLYYIYNAPSASSILSSSNYTLAQVKTGYSSAVCSEMTKGNTTYLDTTSTYYSLPVAYLTNSQLNAANTDAGEGSGKVVGLSFWDSTEETTPGTNSHWAYLNTTIDIDVVDGTAPKAAIDPFYWNSLADNSIYGTTSKTTKENLLGHIELESDWAASGNKSGTTGEYDGDPKVSGQIVIKGSAYDNRMLSALYMAIDGFTFPNAASSTTPSASSFGFGADGTNKTAAATTYYKVATCTNGTWSTSDYYSAYGWKFTVTPDYLNQSGHHVTWELDWNSEKLGVVTDANIRVIAVDARTTVGNASSETAATADSAVTAYNKPLYRVDVVPYITAVKTSMSTLKQSNPSVYDRTSNGRYPVDAGTSAKNGYVYFKGFNISGTPTVSASRYPANSATTITAALVTDSASTYYGYYTVDMYTISSGKFDLKVGTNSVVTLNNYNNNDSYGAYAANATKTYDDYNNAYNRVPNDESNNLLTDDVYFDVWHFNNRAAETIGSGLIVEPIMKVNPSSHMLGLAFANGPNYFSMSNGTTNSYATWQMNYAKNIGTGFTYDENGVSHGTTVGLDTNPSNTPAHAGRFTYVTSKWGIGSTNDQGGNYNGYRTTRLESIGLYSDNTSSTFYNGGYGGIMEDRFHTPSIVATVNGRTNPTVYLAYYDDLKQEIRFRYGTNSIDGTSTYNSNGWKGTGNTFNQFADQYANNIGLEANRVFYDNDGGRYSNGTYYDVGKDYYSVIASGSSTGFKPGEFVDIAVKPGTSAATDVVAMVWYDATNTCLMYSYKVNPCNDNDYSSANAGSDGYWSTPKMILDDAGEHCKVTFGANDNSVHIAAYDIANANLVYAYLPSYSNVDQVYTCTVDAYGITGTNISIDTAVSANGNVIPYISYYTQSSIRPKFAYLVEPATGTFATNAAHAPAGVDATNSDLYTGAWEVTMIPTSSRVIQDHVSVGVWKTTAGVITYSTKNGAALATDNSNVGSSQYGTANGTCYGNGTKNPAIGYAIKESTLGYYETAQKQ